MRTIKYGVWVDTSKYTSDEDRWCLSKNFSSPWNTMVNKEGRFVSEDINAAYRFIEYLSLLFPSAKYDVREIND